MQRERAHDRNILKDDVELGRALQQVFPDPAAYDLSLSDQFCGYRQ